MLRRTTIALALSVACLAACDDAPAGTGGASSASSTDSASSNVASSSGDASVSTSGAGTGTSTSASSTTGAGGSGGSGGAGGGAPVAGYGALSGTCGEVDLDDVLSPSPQILLSAIDFTQRPAFDVMYLSPGGLAMYNAGNLNQSSLFSEIFAYEVLYRCDAATFLKGEADIVYDTNSKKTDLLVGIDGEKVGVSVVRAVSFPKGSAYPVSQAYSVLEGKLSDILLSSASVSAGDKWKKQILSIIAQDQLHADAMVQAYAMIDPAVKADTIVVMTVTDGDDDFIYYNTN